MFLLYLLWIGFPTPRAAFGRLARKRRRDSDYLFSDAREDEEEVLTSLGESPIVYCFYRVWRKVLLHIFLANSRCGSSFISVFLQIYWNRLILLFDSPLLVSKIQGGTKYVSKEKVQVMDQKHCT